MGILSTKIYSTDVVQVTQISQESRIGLINDLDSVAKTKEKLINNDCSLLSFLTIDMRCKLQDDRYINNINNNEAYIASQILESLISKLKSDKIYEGHDISLKIDNGKVTTQKLEKTGTFFKLSTSDHNLSDLILLDTRQADVRRYLVFDKVNKLYLSCFIKDYFSVVIHKVDYESKNESQAKELFNNYIDEYNELSFDIDTMYWGLPSY
ncbi:MAG: hypothetical protein HQL46_13015 [Gammaproteobacteria bacterium]|nr:hypothetical protein [Gammaproteobacteria bacterium]